MSQKKDDGLTGDQRWARKRQGYIDALKSAPCIDCGGTFPPECMDFDHVRGRKYLTIGQLMHRSMKLLLKELKKCELVCANCHRTRTKKRRTRGT